MALGCSGMSGGVAMTGTGGGAPAGIVVISASFALAANGYATTVHGLHEAHRLWKEGPPPDAPAPAPAPQEQLLKPKTQPKQPATTAPPAQAAPAKPAPQVQQAKPVQPAKPAQTVTRTVTRDRKTGEIVKAPAGAKPQQAPAQAGADVKPKGAKRGPRTDPDAPHNAAIKREVEKLRAQGNKVIAGGENPEKVVKTTGGLKDSRRPDIIYITPDGQRRGRNVGKTKVDGTPVKREKEALDDLNKYSDTPTDFVSYDR